jgi:uncharacterized protein (TIGR04255 family)
MRTINAVSKLYDAHPKADDLKFTSLILRYIDAVEFDYAANDAYAFMRDKLKASLALPRNLFEQTGVRDQPDSFTWQSAFKCSSPPGIVTIRFASGKKEEKPAIVWETTVQSGRDNVPEMPSGFEGWIDAAHSITDDWFFKLIEGELERRFSDG